MLRVLVLPLLLVAGSYTDIMAQCASTAPDNTHGNWAALSPAPTCGQQGPFLGQGAGSYIYYSTTALSGSYCSFYLASNGANIGCAESGYYTTGDVGPYTNINNTWGTSLAPAGTNYVKITTTNSSSSWTSNSAVLYYMYATPSANAWTADPTTACINVAQTYTASTSTNTTVYNWSVTGVAATYSATTTSPTQNITFTGSGTATVNITSSNNNKCNATTLSVNVTVYALSQIGSPNYTSVDFCSATGDYSVGTGGTGISIAGAVGTVTWQYSCSNGCGPNAYSSAGTPDASHCCFPAKVAVTDGNPDRIRYIVQNGVCPATAYSSYITLINHYSPTPTMSVTGGSSSTTYSYCNSSPPGSIAVTALFSAAPSDLGTVELWKGACVTGTMIASTNLSGTTSLTSYPFSITSANYPTVGTSQTYYVRYNPNTTSGTCSPLCVATPVTITNYATAVAPTLTTASPATGNTVCQSYGNVSVTATGAGSGGGSGSVDQYQFSTNGGGSYTGYTIGTNIPTAAATGSIIVQAQRTAGSGGCAASAWSTIATWPIGTAPGSPTLLSASPPNGSNVCQSYGNVVATANPGSGGSTGAGDIYQVSTNGGLTYNPYTIGTNIPTGSATTSIIVQAARTGGSYGCTTTAYTTIATWYITAPTVAPTLLLATPSSGVSICPSYGTVSATANPGTGGSTGAADDYIYSTNGGSTFSAYTPGTNIPTASATTQIIIQARRTGGSYGCSTAGYNTIAYWIINAPTVAPTLGTPSPAAGSTVCTDYGTVSTTVNPGSGGSTGATDLVQYSTDGGTTWSTYTSGNSIPTLGATVSIIVRAQRSGGSYGCSTAGPNTLVTWPIGSPTIAPTAGTATPPTTNSICAGYNVSATITAGSGGSSGAADLYQYSIDGGISFSTYTSGTSINTSSATGNIIIQAQRSGGSYGCSTAGPNTLFTWTLASPAVAPTLNTATPASGTTVCTTYGTVSATINAGSGGSTGASDVYQYSTNGGTSYTTYVPGASINTSGATGSIIVRAEHTAGSYGCTTAGFNTLATWPVSQVPTASATGITSVNTCTAVGSYTIPTGDYTSSNGTISWSASSTSGTTGTLSNPTTLTPTYTFSAADIAAGATVTLTLTVANSPCASATATFTINIGLTPTPTFTTTPGSPICTYTNATYTTQPGQSSYVWTGFGTAGTDYNIVSGGLTGTDNTVTLQWLTAGTKNVSVTYTSGYCAATTPATNSTIVTGRPTPTISTAGSACTGSLITYTTDPGFSPNYVWTFSGVAGVDYNLSPGTGTNTSNTAGVTWLTSGSKTVTVNYSSSGCSALTPTSNTKTVTAGPTSASLSNVLDPCAGGYAAQVNITGGTAPYTFSLTCTGTYTGVAVPYDADIAASTSCSLYSVYDANTCPYTGLVSGNPTTFSPTGAITSGATEACTIGSNVTQTFFDGSAKLMASVQSGTTALGATTVVTTVDGSVNTAGTLHPQHYLQRHFQISPAVTTVPATVCLYISDAEVTALNAASGSDGHGYGTFPTNATGLSSSTVNITKYDGGSETPASHTSETVITSITATHNPTVDGISYSSVWQVCFGVNGFSGFYIHATNVNNDPLPVTLISFTATAVENKYINLEWSTASETDNSGFQIERSTDGKEYQAIGWVEGHGNSTVVNDYQFSDMTPTPGTVYYYRLKQIDLDGNYTYSNIASATLTGDIGFSLESLVPNPASSQVAIGVISNVNTTATIVMTDMLGRVVLNQEWPMSVGYNTSHFDLSGMAEGAYNVTIFSGSIKTSKKLVITK